MATKNGSSIDSTQTGYSHKKFDCGYKHKKFDRVLRRKQRKLQLSKCHQPRELTMMATPTTQLSKSTQALFRPYDLDATNTPRKRKMEEITNEAHGEIKQTVTVNIHPAIQHYGAVTPAVINNNQSYVGAFTLDKRTLAMMLQKQREVLYMRNFLQFNGNGNGWPTLLTPAPVMGNIC